MLSVQRFWMSAAGVRHFVCLQGRDVGMKSNFCWHKNVNVLVDELFSTLTT